jgi:hypothetical protein
MTYSSLLLLDEQESFMMIVSKDTKICFKILIPSSFSIKGSFSHGNPIYQIFGISSINSKPALISSFNSFDEAKEAKIQLDLAMDN